MARLLGFDTGGTYTDAVLYDPEVGVVASAKALTTKHDLSIGLRAAAQTVLDGVDPTGIALVSISTTLATNALVEGQGAPAGLILIGQDARTLERAGLGDALKGDPYVCIAGGHNAQGEALVPLDVEALQASATQMADKVSAFALAGYFSVRNPAHELQAREVLRALADLPVTCAHELTSNLDAPRRALTTLFNARLIPMIHGLIRAVQGLLDARDIKAPMMVVRGDGALISAEMALTSPIETILSGPAASVVGAHHLAGVGDCLVSDIGGTTTDIAMLKDGRPLIEKRGAMVGGWRTMVEAVAVHTYGLGGDSEIAVDGGKLTVGPRRAVPISLLARDHPHILKTLTAQIESDRVKDEDARFAVRLRTLDSAKAALTSSEGRIWERLEAGPMDLHSLLESPAFLRPLMRLVDRGLVILSTFTPSDASHVLGQQDDWNRAAAELAARLIGRKLRPVCEDPQAVARQAVERLIVRSAIAIAESVLDAQGAPITDRSAFSAWMLESAAGRAQDRDDLDLRFRLKPKLIAIGAPAATYYPEIANRLQADLLVPAFAGVTNAVGAVTGAIFETVEVLITSPDEGRFRAHLPDRVEDFGNLKSAVARASQEAERHALTRAQNAGAATPKVETEVDETFAELGGGQRLFVEAKVKSRAFGRPRAAL